MNLNPVSKNKLSLLRKLNRKKHRQKEALFMVEGERAVAQVLANNEVRVEAVFFDARQNLWAQEEWTSIQRGIDCYSMDPSDFAEITDTENPQGIFALCRIPPESTLQDLAEKRGILIATDGIQDPGNLGTIIRSASWFGINGILAGHGTVDLYHPKVVRGTAGATGVLPYRNTDLVSELSYLEEHGWQVVLLDGGSGSLDLHAFEPKEKTVLVVGNEGNGLARQLLKQDWLKVKIPAADAAPAVESLNASIAVSIALYALSRGR